MKVKENLWTEPEFDRELYGADMLPHDIDQMNVSEFYKASDLLKPILVTIKDITLKNFAQEGKEADNKWIFSFHEVDKKLSLGPENQVLCAQALNTRDPHNWFNQKIVLFNDPTVRFGNRIVGGVRIRAPKNQPPVQPPVQQQPQASPEQAVDPELTQFDDDIPF